MSSEAYPAILWKSWSDVIADPMVYLRAHLSGSKTGQISVKRAPRLLQLKTHFEVIRNGRLRVVSVPKQKYTYLPVVMVV